MSESAASGGDDLVRVRHVLVVDDDPGINQLLCLRLKRRGFDVTSAKDGEEALPQLIGPAEARPDLVFLDLSMPRMGGLEVLERVRQAGTDVAVIIMTAQGSEKVAIESLQLGADDYLRKPLEVQELEAVLERAVARQLLRRQNLALQAQLEQEHRQRDRLEGVLLAARTFEHELGNKLAITVGYAEMLARDPALPPRLQERAAHILRGAREATEIIRQAMEITSVEMSDWGPVGNRTIKLPGSSGSPPPTIHRLDREAR